MTRFLFEQTLYPLDYIKILPFLQNENGFKGQVRDLKTTRVQVIYTKHF